MTNGATRLLPFCVPLLLTVSLHAHVVDASEGGTILSFGRETKSPSIFKGDDHHVVGSLHLSQNTIVGHHHQQQPEPYHSLLRQRLLNSFEAPASSQGKIAWFCFVAVGVIAPLTCCAILYACRVHKRQEQERAQQEEQATTAISRIEANVKVFTEIEDQRRMQTIRRTMKRHLFVVREEDLMALPRSSDDENDDAPEITPGWTSMTAACFRQELASPCSICLEPFTKGETLMHSIDVDSCRHVFHELCISSWLVKQNTTICPCCRQPFVGTGSPVTSLNSNEQFESAVGDGGTVSSGSSPPRTTNEEDEPLEGQV